MALIDLWRGSRDQISAKHVQQIVGFAGDGKLGDGNLSSFEFRTFLAQIPSPILIRYASECLVDSFSGSGLVLQDAVNETGSRQSILLVCFPSASVRLFSRHRSFVCGFRLRL